MFEGVLLDPFLSEERVYERLKREFQKYGKLIIAYDFDYTINSYRNEPWEYPEVVQLLKEWKDKAHFICYTASPEERYPEMINKTKELGVPLDYINENIPGVNVSSSGKIYYSILLDDRAGIGECVRVLKRLLKEIKESEGGKMRLWEILKEISNGKVKKGTVYKAIDSIIQLEVEYDGCDLVYSNIMGDTETRDSVKLCSGELSTNFMKMGE